MFVELYFGSSGNMTWRYAVIFHSLIAYSHKSPYEWFFTKKPVLFFLLKRSSVCTLWKKLELTLISCLQGFCDTRDPDVMLVRPMRDFMKKEVVFYNIFNKLESVFVPSLGTKVTLLVILEKLISTIGLLITNQIISFYGLYIYVYCIVCYNQS